MEYAIHLANKHTLPLIVFTSTSSDQYIQDYHLAFRHQCIHSLTSALESREIGCINIKGSVVDLLHYTHADIDTLIVDRGYLKEPQDTESALLHNYQFPIVRVESNLVVPVDYASPKQEYAAYTLRPKIHKLASEFLLDIKAISIENPSLLFAKNYQKETIPSHVYLNVNTIQNNGNFLQGGEPQAQRRLSYFLEHNFVDYGELARDPSAGKGEGVTSNLSPYLAHGAISPIDVVQQVRTRVHDWGIILSPRVNKEDLNAESWTLKDKNTIDPAILAKLKDSYASFFEELVVRRELAFNFVNHNIRYADFEGIPSWAQLTLEEHQDDQRPQLYSKEQLECAHTEDPYWNAAQSQLLSSGTMHGYMRMYWGKKIMEWLPSMKDAFDLSLYLNNRYALDGNDPSSYTGVSWCYGTHDRPHPTRPVFGSVRYMTAQGLRKKFDIQTYVERWNARR